ncbi:hypothetical protein C8R45DRAFT_1017671 [Mycena sanguinolenta]|nr:hypothetical protein C8R45DRAFT_1017671 [Mycena sanguinolenta]
MHSSTFIFVLTSVLLCARVQGSPVGRSISHVADLTVPKVLSDLSLARRDDASVVDRTEVKELQEHEVPRQCILCKDAPSATLSDSDSSLNTP